MAYDRSKVRLKGHKHPFLTALTTYPNTLTDLALAIGVRPQSVNTWKSSCQKDRHFLFPAEQVPALARELGIPRENLRPDLWP